MYNVFLLTVSPSLNFCPFSVIRHDFWLPPLYNCVGYELFMNCNKHTLFISISVFPVNIFD